MFVRWVVVAGAIACGSDPGPGNEKACEDYVSSLQCGDVDVSSIYSATFCSDFGGAECDVKPYFDCLRDNIVCDEETGDFAIDPDFACGALAQCL